MLFYNEQGSGLASLTKRRLDHHNIPFSKSEKVEIITLDSYLLNKNIERVNLLKIDIEGHELDCLNGAHNAFLNNKIDFVTFEFGGCNIDTRTYFQDFWYFFKEFDFEIARILHNGRILKITAYSEICEQFMTSNYICFKKSFGI